MRINYQLLSQHLESWKQLIKREDGRRFESFGSSQYLKEQEGYKRKLNDLALEYLDYSSWKPKDIGSGNIVEKLIKAIEAPDENNLVYTSQYSHSDAGSPIKKIKEILAQDQTTKIELILYNLFHQKTSDEEVFQELTDIIGKRYSVITYIFFLKNIRQYVPVAPGSFEKKLSKIGVNLNLSHQCSWQNYQQFLTILKEIQSYLKEALNDEEIYLIDTHSFVWMLDRVQPATKKTFSIEEIESELTGKKVTIAPRLSNKSTDQDQLNQTLDKQKTTGKKTESLVINYFKNKQGVSKVESFTTKEVNKGYDICVIDNDQERHVEIKTAQKYSDNKLSFYVSYKELQVGAQDSDWEILAVVKTGSNKITCHRINQKLAKQALDKMRQLLNGAGFALKPLTMRVVVGLK